MKTDRACLDAMRTAPPIAHCPWMRVEVVGERGRPIVFALAVHDGWIVGGARIGRKLVGQRARDVWKLWISRGAKLDRIG